MTEQRKDDLELVTAATPLIRGVLAFLVYLRFGTMREIEACYETADQFVNRLKADLEKAE